MVDKQELLKAARQLVGEHKLDKALKTINEVIATIKNNKVLVDEKETWSITCGLGPRRPRSRFTNYGTLSLRVCKRFGQQDVHN